MHESSGQKIDKGDVFVEDDGCFFLAAFPEGNAFGNSLITVYDGWQEKLSKSNSLTTPDPILCFVL